MFEEAVRDRKETLVWCAEAVKRRKELGTKVDSLKQCGEECFSFRSQALKFSDN